MPEKLETRMVGMGQLIVPSPPAILTAVLGSCVGVAIYCPRLRLGSLAHVVLPRSSNNAPISGKFADLAVPAMVEQLEQLGAVRSGLIAKIAGGACMFDSGGPLQIGAANIEAVTQALAAVKISIAGQDVGGNKGRRVRFHCGDGSLTVEIMGSPPKVL